MLFLLLIMVAESRMQNPRKKPSRRGFRNSINTLQIIEEPYLERSQLTIQRERLQFEQSLVEEQELLEEDISQFQFNTTYFQNVLTDSKQIVVQQMKDNKIVIVTISVFSLIIIILLILLKKQAKQKHNKKRKHDEQQQILTQSIYHEQYSILNSKTISSNDQSQRYNIIEYQPQIKDPYEESFVKQSLKATTAKTNYDQSLLDIDELLKEMVG